MGKRITLMALALMTMSLQLASVSAGSGVVKKIDFKPGDTTTMLVFHFDGNPKFRIFQSEKQGNVILEAENLQLPPQLTRVIDGASSAGPVLQVTPYNSGDNKRSIAKIVVQLRDKADVTTSEMDGKFVMEVKRKFSVGAAVDAAMKNTNGSKFEKLNRKIWSESDQLRNRSGANEKGEEIAKRLVEVLNAPPEDKIFFGSKVTFEGTMVSVHDIFRLVGEASGLNIITDSDVTYASNYSLKDIPWDQLLDIVIQQANLKAAVTGNVVRIITFAKFTLEQEAKLREIGTADQMEPVVLAVVPLSYATAETMRTMINTLLTKRSTSTAPASTSAPTASTGGTGSSSTAGSAADQRFIQDFVRGQIEVDSRSNSLIITNTRETIERIRRLVRELDVALPQVLIDAKIVIASEQFTRKIGVSWGGRATSSSFRSGPLAGFNSPGIVSLGQHVAGVDNAVRTGFSITPGANEGAFGYNFGAGQRGNIGLQLQLAEANGISKTVASPRVIVNNKKQATISDGQTLLIQTTAGANASGSVTQIAASLSLNVTPQVTSDGSVLLTVNVTKDNPVITPTGTTVENKSINTEVLVESGNTLVLGGVYQNVVAKGENGIPLLKELPFIGQLFRNDSYSNTKNELMVFITPEIVEPPAPKAAPEQDTPPAGTMPTPLPQPTTPLPM